MFDDLDLPAPTTADNIPESGQGEKTEASAPLEAPSDSLENRIDSLKQAGKIRSKYSRIYSILAILFFSTFLGGAVYAGYYFWDEISIYFSSEESGDIFICNLETKECPDGSLVSRVPPDCEFKECLPAAAVDCAEEGEFIIAADLNDSNIACCEGLSAWAAYSAIDGDCQRLIGEEVCINCPDGVCGEGENKCNCPEDCSSASEEATSTPVNRCELEPDTGPCRAKFTGYFYNWDEEGCREFIWGGCEGLVPFNSLEECQEECENVSTSTEIMDIDSATSSAKVVAALDTSDWQTYKNEEYGFEFKYPSSHNPYTAVGVSPDDPTRGRLIYATSSSENVSIAVDESLVICCEPVVLSVKPIKNESSARGWFNTNQSQYIEEVSIITINDILFLNRQALEVLGQGSLGSPYKLIVVEMQNYLLLLTESMHEKLLDNILLTFKFIDSDISTSTSELTAVQDAMISECGECDDDQDGLINSDEDKYGTDKENPDTDGDGYLDGDEVKSGYNPNGEGKL